MFKWDTTQKIVPSGVSEKCNQLLTNSSSLGFLFLDGVLKQKWPLDIKARNEATWAMIKGQQESLYKLPVIRPFYDWIIYVVHRLSVVCSSVIFILQYRAHDIQSKLSCGLRSEGFRRWESARCGPIQTCDIIKSCIFIPFSGHLRCFHSLHILKLLIRKVNESKSQIPCYKSRWVNRISILGLRNRWGQ